MTKCFFSLSDETGILDTICFSEVLDSLNLEYENLNNLTSLLINRYTSDLKYYNLFPKEDLKKNWIIQNQIKLAAQSLNALYLLKNEIPTNQDNDENDLINSTVDTYFNQTIELIEETHKLEYKEEARGPGARG